MRVVFDTNIFISALVIPGGQAEKAILRITSGHDTLLISKPILDEVLSTLAGKFSRDMEALSRVAVSLTEMSEVITSHKKLKVFEDEPDNRILECALAGNAERIATGDKEMLRLKHYRGIRILSLREYLDTPLPSGPSVLS
ncbi:MAG: putative toxin-antitoxin system toxin component, PIN family [Nitrospirae bacterium]|nr:putative toxin-antitoxin system toxin component, PIN family [Nitrospirota bacterium]